MPTIRDVACTACGCVCDDLTIQVQQGQVVAAEGACELSRGWWLAQTATGPAEPTAGGRSVTYPQALEQAAQLLRGSRAPLIWCLSPTSTATQRAACALADRLGATIDTAGDHCQVASLLALQAVGQSTASLGEVKNRADVVVYWGCNPLRSHPRHWERTVAVPGVFVPAGRRDRRVLVVDVQQTATAQLADRLFQVTPGADFDLLWALRAALRGCATEQVGGIPAAAIGELAQLLKSAKYAAFFWGPGLTRHGVPMANVQALLQLITDLNAHTRAVGCLLGQPNATQVLCWQTGYSLGVNLAHGYPRSHPEEDTADVLLRRQEVDLVVRVGGGSGPAAAPAPQPPAAGQHLPHIVLDSPTAAAGGEAARDADIYFPTATDGVHRGGTIFRMDEVAIPLRAVLSSTLPSAAEVLQDLEKTLAVPPA